ncbi:MAG: DUF1800 domain-containing protein [Alphaproteobacteria bacterium]|nr:DUF1800 domain-containing protein [Alphaproteobacteria bacterium]
MAARAAAVVATARFGLGAAPGEIAAAATDPRGWVRQQLVPQAMPPALAGLPDGGERTRLFLAARRAMQEQRRDRPAAADQPPRAALPPGMEQPREAYLHEAGLRMRAQIESKAPAIERLVAFWSNHFTVSILRPPVLALAGAFEREAIRPHVLGRFEDMLLAVARHQAMLLYLDNALSIGPNSRAGRRRARGINENLAREILELHTLGVDAGYTQDDVRALAMILTGWSIARLDDADPGGFRFRPLAHEPGDKTLLGKRYTEDGEREGIGALKDLARHPATARHIARKLACHFIADDPPSASIERLAATFRAAGGDLAAVMRALVGEDAAWAKPLSKVRPPAELVVAALRATGYPAATQGDGRRLIGALRRLGQAPFAAPSPAGWPDTASDWTAPEAVVRRVEWATALAGRFAAEIAPMELFAQSIAPASRTETRLAVERAASARDGIALVLAAPEFQRR